jgi:hypothetical protein
MNTANLQLEGLYAAVAALTSALREKGLLSEGEIEEALKRAEQQIGSDPRRTTALSNAHLDAIRFPLRFLRHANETSAQGHAFSFAELATKVGRVKEQV